METRVIVADNARARIFASHTVMDQLEEIGDFVHPQAHWSDQDINADARGKSRHARDSLDPVTPAKKHEAQTFAKMLARHLKELHNRRHYEQLVLIAAPHFLGLLRTELHKSLDPLVTRTIDKDLSASTVEEIIDYIKS